MLLRTNRRPLAAALAAVVVTALSVAVAPAAPASADPAPSVVVPASAVHVFSATEAGQFQALSHERKCPPTRDAAIAPQLWSYLGVTAWIVFPQSTFYPGDMCSMPNNRLIMQTDGNFVVYDQNNQPKWAADTYRVGEYARMQVDGNLVVYNYRNQPVGKRSNTIDSDAVLAVQSDGNVVVYHLDAQNNMTALWWTGTVHN
ncbi:hypothetical protein ACFFX1_36515 [Dactylosporangium sucinum]|uniref:Bulb-type lectin domain-containing protein n=1 Tax=Dactylosporangium sucinum TaxID=1424081 RepID=A0A917TVI3_9ACTN|nr:hypothetical protein [Dactylosporangium sucinum]GGM37431.1 hypothetical protein GCM10007977_043580 [Dactylosporangium sucinum]